MSRHPLTRLAPAVALLAVTALTACSSPAEPADGDVLRVVTPYTIKNLDPLQQGLWAPEWGYGELLMRATEHGTVEPWLLESIEHHTPTGWRLDLKPGIAFHNGNPLNAAALDAVFEANLSGNKRTGSLLAGAVVGTDGPLTVIIETRSPTPNLPNILADEGVLPVYDVAALAAVPDRTDDAAIAAAGIYTGPFTVASLTPDRLTLKRNDAHRDGPPALDGVEVSFVEDGQARVLAVRSGEADLAFYPPTEALRNLGDDVRVIDATANPSPLRGFVNTRGPLGDVAVRRALALAIDYASLSADAMDGLYSPPIGMFPASVPYARQDLRTDTAEAARLLDAAGWGFRDGIRAKDGKALTITVLSYGSQPDTAVIATALQAQLSATGFAVEVRDVPANYEAMADPAGWDVGLSFDSALGTTYDPLGRLHDFLHTEGQYNFGAVGDTELDHLLDELSATFDEDERTRLLDEIQRHAVAEQAYALFLADRPARVVAAPAYAGYTVSSVLQHVGTATGPGAS
ncbi:ABC transporter substrate-binding protein [Phytomonospora endophytica]|uniref:Peptide/nickel transport system substrate-binding protein n=1 Tax=Phytomonospora endophytica TaxID=714109 RepID=A0A841FGA1_9ACTN|nr:ABC transporter substrate-binding protein [Phytomonospora endophytica]MBB6034894.1 peptide/nickel transport system substrate-binding protein [Phytomonospora endophytica]GIG70598.1 ABC transporter substrate-binding protein [Phytomonospora endophytica]